MLTKWSLPDLKTMQNRILRHIYKICFFHFFQAFVCVFCKCVLELNFATINSLHCKDKLLKIWNKYSQIRNIGASVPISTFMCLWANYIFPWWVCLFYWRKYVDWSWEYINHSKTHECGNWGWGRAIPRKGIAVAVWQSQVVKIVTPYCKYIHPHSRHDRFLIAFAFEKKWLRRWNGCWEVLVQNGEKKLCCIFNCALTFIFA